MHICGEEIQAFLTAVGALTLLSPWLKPVIQWLKERV